MSNNISTQKIIIGLIVLGIIGFFVGNLLSSQNEMTTNAVATEQTEERAMAEAETMEEADEMDIQMEADPNLSDVQMNVDDEDLMAVAGPGEYTEYDPALLANAEEGDVILFFHAGWCPSCRGLEKDIEKNLGDIPSGVTIMKLNYDSETELKKKYGVVRQHTLVRVDSEGNMIETLTGLTNTLDQVVAQL